MDATVAFIIILVTIQLCLLWLAMVVDGTVAFHEHTTEQKKLIDASDRLISDPDCLAKVDNGHVVPQTINGYLADGKIHDGCGAGDVNYGLVTSPQSHGGLVVRRLVFVDEEGGDVSVLEVW